MFFYLCPFDVGEDSRTNPFNERGNDENHQGNCEVQLSRLNIVELISRLTNPLKFKIIIYDSKFLMT